MKYVLKTFLVFILLTIISLAGCNKSSEAISEATLNSIINPEPIFTNGFSFELGESVNYPVATDVLPDFLLNDRYDSISHALVGTSFVGYDFPEKHFKLYSFYKQSAQAAKAFKKLHNASIKDLQNQTGDLKANQVWIYSGKNGFIGKILILEVNIRQGQPQRYTEVTFRWDKL
jgi:hypothetical protein